MSFLILTLIQDFFSWPTLSIKDESSELSFSFPFSIFRTRVRVRVTISCCHTFGHIIWQSHKSHDTWKKVDVKIVDGGLYFIFSFHFYFTFYFFFFFIFLFLEQLRLEFISHAVTSVTNWWRSHKTDHETWEKGVEGTRIKWRHTAWTTHAGLM